MVRFYRFFTSEESTEISGLSAYRETHQETCQVVTTTVKSICEEHKLTHVDFLNIDTEGFDLMVLKGVPWDRIRPDVIECKFEDRKIVPLGYTFDDIAQYLIDKGYSVFVSEWHPIIRYGMKHDWHRLVMYPCILADQNAWGNLLAFRKPPALAQLTRIVQTLVKVQSPQNNNSPTKFDSPLTIPHQQGKPQVNVAQTNTNGKVSPDSRNSNNMQPAGREIPSDRGSTDRPQDERFQDTQVEIKHNQLLEGQSLPAQILPSEPIPGVKGVISRISHYYSRWPLAIALLAAGLNIGSALDTPYRTVLSGGGSALIFFLIGHAASKGDYALSSAERAQASINHVRGIADIASGLAQEAKELVNRTQTKAQNAMQRASQSYKRSNSAMDKANGAMDKANGAMDKANGAMDKANGAMDKANGAMDKANTVMKEVSHLSQQVKMANYEGWGPLRLISSQALAGEPQLSGRWRQFGHANLAVSPQLEMPRLHNLQVLSPEQRAAFEAMFDGSVNPVPPPQDVELIGWCVDHRFGTIIFDDLLPGTPAFRPMFSDTWSSWFPHWFPQWRTIGKYHYLDETVGPIHHVAGSAVYCGTRFPHNYYHWWVDVLRRALVALRDDACAGLPIVIPVELPPFGSRLLERLGIDKDRLHRPTRDVERFERLIVPHSDFWGGRVNLAYGGDILDVAKCIGEEFAFAGNRTKKLYVSRRDAAIRHATNVDDVEACLRQAGFQIVHAAHLTVDEQITLFRQARLVCGITGSGMTNVLFSAPGTPVVEIMPTTLPNTFISYLCNMLGHPYSMVVGKAHGHGSDKSLLAREDDVEVPIGQLLSVIEALL